VEVVASLSQGRTAAAQCGLFTHKSVPVIFEPPYISLLYLNLIVLKEKYCCVILGRRHEIDIFAVLGCYSASCGDSLSTFRDISCPPKIGKKLPSLAA